jgi:hypothetical protein
MVDSLLRKPMRTRILAALILLAAGAAFGQEAQSPVQIDVNGAGYLTDMIPYDQVGLHLFDEFGLLASYRMPHLLVHTEAAIRNDGAYTSEEPAFMLGHYIDIKAASVTVDFAGLTLKAGRYAHTDVVDSPYSLFISSAARPALAVDMKYEDSRFFYESRWVQLNYLSTLYTFPTTTTRLDRGMNYKVYGLKFGDLRFGFQDSIVYVGRNFDAEYFISPMFQYLQQIVSSTDGKPWTQENNCNSLMGFFFDIDKPDYYAYAQVLIDDINMDFLGFWGKLALPTKIAWSLGGHMDFPFGRIGAYTAGATKYTFEATVVNSTSYSVYPYEYAYYPASQYMLNDGYSTVMTLDYTDNYIGYKYGENNLALMINWAKEFSPVMLSAQLEYVVNGSKSPSNPWQELGGKENAWYDLPWLTHSAFYLLEDPQLEHTLLGTMAATFRMGRFEANAQVKLGGRWNSLQLVEDVVGEPKIFRPVGADRFLYQVRLGVTWHFFN